MPLFQKDNQGVDFTLLLLTMSIDQACNKWIIDVLENNPFIANVLEKRTRISNRNRRFKALLTSRFWIFQF